MDTQHCPPSGTSTNKINNYCGLGGGRCSIVSAQVERERGREGGREREREREGRGEGERQSQRASETMLYD